MKKKIKACILALFVISIIAAVSYSNGSIKISRPHTNQDEIKLVIDSPNEQELPKYFRKTSDKINITDGKQVNLKGLNTLNISGSHQFSEKGLALIKKSIGQGVRIVVVDLRQESHGFINGIAVSWANEKNDANIGLTLEQVFADENTRLKGIPLNKPITLDDEKVIPTKVENELKLVESQGMLYVRIPVTDGKMPTDDMVDYFVRFVNSKPQNLWPHFHCRAGVGRTTTFMIMYDMMKNSKEVSAEDIIDRQVMLANLSDHSRESFYSEERMGFLNNFYKYCRENADSFKTTWSMWKSSQH